MLRYEGVYGRGNQDLGCGVPLTLGILRLRGPHGPCLRLYDPAANPILVLLGWSTFATVNVFY